MVTRNIKILYVKVTLKAFAKINLFLEVLKKDPNVSLHNIETVVQNVSLYDVIKIECSKSKNELDSKININTDCEDLKRLSPTLNSAYVACKEILKYNSVTGINVKINIKKNIPLKSGLGGESADAAAVLVGLNYLLGSNLSTIELSKLAFCIGSDVPLFILGGTIVSCSSKFKLKKILKLPKCHILICKPDFGILTKDAYRMFDDKYKTQKYKKISIDSILSSMNEQDIEKISKYTYNRFEEVLENEDILNLKKVIIKNGALSAGMSGSGSAVFGLFKDYTKASICKNKLNTRYKYVFICKPVDIGQEFTQ